MAAKVSIVDSGGIAIFPNEPLLDYRQLSNTQGILSASVLTILNNPIATDLITLVGGAASGLYANGANVAGGVASKHCTWGGNRQFIYVVNTTSATISKYLINLNNFRLTEIGVPTVVGAGAYGITNDGTGAYIYVRCRSAGTIEKFAVNLSTGELTPIGVPTVLAGGSYLICSDGTGNAIYSANTSTNTITKFRITAGTGDLTPIGTPTATGNAPIGIASDKIGGAIYTASTSSDTVSKFKIDPVTFDLTPVGSPSALAAGATPYFLTSDILGHSLYVLNYGNATITKFAINASTKDLVEIGTPIATGSSPLVACADTLGNYIFAASSSENKIYSYSRNTTTGDLTLLGSITTGTGTSPQGITCAGVGVYVSNGVGVAVSQYAISTYVRVYTATGMGDVDYAIGASKEDTMANLAAAITGDASGGWNAYVGTGLTSIAATTVVIAAKATALAGSRIFGTWATPANIKIVDFTAPIRDYLPKTLINMPTTLPTVSNFGFERTVTNLLPKETHYCRNNTGTHKEFYWDAEQVKWISTAATNFKVVTDTYTIRVTDDEIICNKGTLFTVTLPVATSSGDEKQIKNIGVGTVTLEGDGGDTIDGELNQAILTWDNLVVKDYAANKWIIL